MLRSEMNGELFASCMARPAFSPVRNMSCCSWGKAYGTWN